MQTIKLYHISFDITEPLEKEFIPKIPTNTATGEDESTPRVCLSDSIVGCINAAEDKFGDYEDIDKASIVVWEKEFSLPDDKLICWKDLYEHNLVPDAALTHEYWYLDKLRMRGSLYEITNINDAISNKKLVYIIKPQYKNKVLSILKKHDISLREATDDLYSLINEWLPMTHPQKFNTIIDELKKVIRVSGKTDINISDYKNILFDDFIMQNSVLDMDCQKIYQNLIIKKLS